MQKQFFESLPVEFLCRYENKHFIGKTEIYSKKSPKVKARHFTTIQTLQNMNFCRTVFFYWPAIAVIGYCFPVQF